MEQVAQKVFDILNNKLNDPEIKTFDSNSKDTSDIEEARIFSFDFVVSAQNYGPVVVLLSSDNDLEIFYGDNTSNTLEAEARNKWDSIIKHLSSVAQRNRLGFKLKNIKKLKYDLSKVSENVTESYKRLFEGYYGTKKTSYNKQGKARIIIKHTRALGEDEQRFRNISSLFIENADGERFKLPFKKLAGARAMARHVQEGGNPYDLFGTHISEMVKDINTLSGFVRRTKMYEEGDQAMSLVTTGRTHYDSKRKGLKQIAGKRGYHMYKEGWEPSEITEQERDVDSIRSLFTERSVNAKVEEALPLIARLQELAERQVAPAAIKMATMEIEPEDGLEENTGATDYNAGSGTGKTRKELLAILKKTKASRDATNARKAGATQVELKSAMDEGDVIQHKFGQKQAQKGKDKYKHNAEIAKDIPMWDPIKKRNIPGGVDYPDHYVDRSTLVPYDHFEAKPTGKGKSAHIMGITTDGYEVQTSTTQMQLANTLVSAYNRGGFTDSDIQKIPLSDVFKEGGDDTAHKLSSGPQRKSHDATGLLHALRSKRRDVYIDFQEVQAYEKRADNSSVEGFLQWKKELDATRKHNAKPEVSGIQDRGGYETMDWPKSNTDEADEFESWADTITEGPETKITTLKDYFSDEQPVGIDAINVMDELGNIITDESFVKAVSDFAEKDPDADARQVVAQWLSDNDPELTQTLGLHGEWDNPSARDFPREGLDNELDADSEEQLSASVNKSVDKYVRKESKDDVTGDSMDKMDKLFDEYVAEAKDEAAEYVLVKGDKIHGAGTREELEAYQDKHHVKGATIKKSTKKPKVDETFVTVENDSLEQLMQRTNFLLKK